MINLDKYMDTSIKVKVFGKELDVMEPSLEMVMKVEAIEEDLTKENVHEKRLEVALLFLNYNRQKEIFEREQIKKLPYEAITSFIAEVSALRYEADKDPN